MTAKRVPTILPPRRALVVTLRFLGDALLSTALVHSIKRRWPECAIDVLTFSGTEGAFEGNADVAQVMAVAERASAGETMRQVLALWRRYDLAVVAQTGTRPFLFGWAAGRQRVGLVSAEPGKSWWKRALLDGYAVFEDRGRVFSRTSVSRTCSESRSLRLWCRLLRVGASSQWPLQSASIRWPCHSPSSIRRRAGATSSGPAMAACRRARPGVARAACRHHRWPGG